MDRPTYPAPCACGATMQVELSAAGTTVPCRCGRAVEVPSLAKLKASVGESAVSADFELEQLAAAGRLPLEDDCVLCYRQTDHVVHVVAECEQAVEGQEEGISATPMSVLLYMFLGIWAFLFLWKRAKRGHGRDLTLSVPVRACEACAAGLTTHDAILVALRKTPVYARLLRKYPDARLLLPKAPV